MTVTTDTIRNEVTIEGEAGSRITLSWSAALLLGTLLREASHEAEPQLKGKTYAPTTERARR
jgi:hypothetical protein